MINLHRYRIRFGNEKGFDVIFQALALSQSQYGQFPECFSRKVDIFAFDVQCSGWISLFR